jgi:hypothetical protein
MIQIKEQTTGLTMALKFEEWIYAFHRWKNEFRVFVLAPWYFLKNVWQFRKELWHFRNWDYMFNNRLYIRSWELTAELLESDSCVTTQDHAHVAAADIRKFIKMLKLSEDGIPEAERIMGIDYLELTQKAYAGKDYFFNWTYTHEEDLTEDQKKFLEMSQLVDQIEKQNWKNAWKFMARKGQHWWD